MSYADFNTDPIETKPIKYNFNSQLGFGEVAPYNKNSITAENIYKSSFLLLQQPNKIRYDKLTRDTVKNISCNSDLSKIYFSDENIKRVQKMLVKEVFEKTKGKFKLDVFQDEKDITYVMRAIFIEHAKDIPNQVVRQVKILNRKVIDEIFPSVITSIQHNHNYLKSINGPVLTGPLLDRPLNVNNAGRKTLPGFSTIWEF